MCLTIFNLNFRSKKKHRPVSGEDHKEKTIVEEVVEETPEAEQMLIQKFKYFDKTFRDVSYILQFWDRTNLMVARPVTPEYGGPPGFGEDEILGKV